VRWTLDPRVAWQQVAGEVVVVDLVSSTAIGLNPTASFIWMRLGSLDDEEIARQLAGEFDIELPDAVVDIKCFLQGLERRQLVKRVDDLARREL